MSSSAENVVAAISIIGRGGQLLFFKSFLDKSEEAALKLHLAVYASLDAVDERVPARRIPAVPGAPLPSPGGFLGLLLPVEDMKCFGYCTATNVKIIVVIKDVLLREDRVRELFRGLHRLYVDAVCAPFSPAGVADAASAEALAQLLGAPRFGTAVARLCEAADLLYRGPVPV
jgi:Sedlin, N-terminal conserved region